MIREYARQTRLYDMLREVMRYYRSRRALHDWEQSGRPVPPPREFKRETVKRYGRKFGQDVLVETGTFQGDMIEATKLHFREIYSVELSQELYRAACRTFARHRHVHLLQGDSAVVLRELLPKLNSPPLIWLDAHFSGDGTARGESVTPVVKELEAILEQKQIDPVVLIDDARLFDGTNGYPTLESVHEMILGARGGWVFEVQDDIIRTHPPRPRTGSRP
jgi:hypothetical protein